MSMRTKKGQKRKVSNITLCIDPKTRFCIELIARIQRNSLSGTIDYCIAKIIENEYADIVSKTWDIEYIKRLKNLGNFGLLSLEEEFELNRIAKEERFLENHPII